MISEFEKNCIDGKGKIVPYKIVESLVGTANFANSCGHLFHYDEKDGAWIDITYDVPNKAIHQYIPKEYQFQVDSIMIRRIVNDLIANPMIFKEFHDDPEVLNIENGILDLKTMGLKDHSRDYGFRYIRRFSFDKDHQINYASSFCRYICSSLGCHDVECNEVVQLMEMIGYVLSEQRDAEQAFYLLGDSNVGKSLILRLVELAFDPREVSSIGLHELGSPFRFTELARSKINILHEMKPVCIKCVDALKKVVSSEPVIAEEKGKRPVRLQPRTVLVSATNIMPQFDAAEINNSLTNRMTVLRFMGKISEEDVDRELFGKLKNEKDIIFSVALRFLGTLRANSMRFTLPEKTDVFMKAFAKSLNSIQSFVNECCELYPEGKVFSKNLYETYVSFARENMLFVHTASTFGGIIRLQPGVENKKIRIAEKSLQGYLGIGIKVKS